MSHKKNSLKIMVVLLAGFASISLEAKAETLSNLALFYRCYGQITQLRASATDPLTVAVKNGTKDPIAACLEVLDRAKFVANSNTTIASSSDPIAQGVLRTFQGLHFSWFSAKQYVFLVNTAPANLEATFDAFDQSAPALYFTKALFDPTAQYKDVVTSSANLRAVRTTMNPTVGAYSGEKISSFPAGSNTPLPGKGDLLGVEATGLLPAGGFNYGLTAGGGFMGTIPYIELNIAGGIPFDMDGAVQTPRRWGRGVFHDVLCRDLPVARESDVTNLVVPQSPTPFRQSAACTKCHASIDRMSGVVRNFRYTFMGPEEAGQIPIGVKFATPSKSAESGWSSSPDGSYASRPPNGVLFFRNYNGTLIDRPVSSISDLGAALADQDDFYICAAKRYYQYFTGISAEIGDISDPDFTKTLSAGDLAHRQTVIELGKKLRTHQKLRQLIEDILKLPSYKASDFGVKGGSQ